MSNRVDLVCCDHGDRLYLGGNNWGLARAWALADSADLIDETMLLGAGDLELHLPGIYFEDEHPQDFLRAHRRCQIVPVSEYPDDGRPRSPGTLQGRVQGPNRRLVDGARAALAGAARALVCHGETSHVPAADPMTGVLRCLLCGVPAESTDALSPCPGGRARSR